jgi:ABC-type Fe3+ transport system permease subunit
MSAPALFATPHRRIAALMTIEAASLAVASALHLAGLVHGRGQSFSAAGAGIAEAVICVVLAAGAIALARQGSAGRPAALAATGFAIVGFVFGLSITARAGDAPDIAYHATVLPLLIVTFVLILRRRAAGARAP